METITTGKKIRVFIKNNGRIVIGGVCIFIVVFIAIFAPFLTKYDPNVTDIYNKYAPPSAEHILGTDVAGNDMWAQIAYGARSSLFIGTVAQIFVMIAGCMLGLICGYFPKIDQILMRILEAINSIPGTLLMFVMVTAFGASFFNMILTFIITSSFGTIRFIRAQVMSLRQKEFVEREVAMGASAPRIMFMHILPQCSSYLLVSFSGGVKDKIMSLASLAFLGIAPAAAEASWGGMLAAGQPVLMLYPFVTFCPMIALIITNFGFALLGDGLRDLMDPKTK